jgi:hypothetical protein
MRLVSRCSRQTVKTLLNVLKCSVLCKENKGKNIRKFAVSQ